MSSGRVRLAGALALMALVSGSLAACDAGGAVPGASPSGGDSSSAAPPAPTVTVTTNVQRGQQDVPVDTAVTVTAQDGTLASVAVTSPEGGVAGDLAADQATWTASDRLEPGTSYVVKTTAGDPDRHPGPPKAR